MTTINKRINIYTNVLDDDEEMNGLLKQLFDMNGMPNVSFFHQSDLFLEALNENIHLCIIDQVIPGSLLQGIDVIKIIRERFPKCQIIFVSGTSDPAVLKEMIRIRPEGYVDKGIGNYTKELVDEVIRCSGEIRRNLELAIGLESYKKRGQ